MPLVSLPVLRCRGAFSRISLLALCHLGVLSDSDLILVSPGHLRPGRLDFARLDVRSFLHRHLSRFDFDGVGLRCSLVVGCFGRRRCDLKRSCIVLV